MARAGFTLLAVLVSSLPAAMSSADPVLTRGPARLAVLVDSAMPGAAAGATLGIAEAGRAAELLRSDLRIERFAVRDPERAERWLAAFRERGGLAAVVVASDPVHRVLERAAEEHGLLIVDARASAGLRCGRWTLRTGAPAAAHALALLRSLGREMMTRWVVVGEPDEPGLRTALRAAVAGASAVAFDPTRGGDAQASAIIATDPAGVVLSGAAERLAPALGRLAPGLPVVVIGLSAAAPPPTIDGLRVALWDPGLFRYGAEQLNARYRELDEAGMGPTGWAVWMAVKAVSESALRSGASTPTALRSHVTQAVFDGHKGEPLVFRVADGQLLQPLYVLDGGRARQVEWPLPEPAGSRCGPGSTSGTN